jgi:hypothetical protein
MELLGMYSKPTASFTIVLTSQVILSAISRYPIDLFLCVIIVSKLVQKFSDMFFFPLSLFLTLTYAAVLHVYFIST